MAEFKLPPGFTPRNTAAPTPATVGAASAAVPRAPTGVTKLKLPPGFTPRPRAVGEDVVTQMPQEDGGLLQPAVPTSALGDIGNSIRRGWNDMERTSALTGLVTGADSNAAIEDASKQTQENQAFPASPELLQQQAEYEKTGAGWDAAKYLMTHPRLAGTKFAGSAPAFIPGVAATAGGAVSGGAVGGAAAGPVGAAVGGAAGAFAAGGAASGLQKFGEIVTERLTAHGVDLSDPESMKAAFADQAFIDDVRAEATRSGIAQGVVDGAFTALGGGIGGAILKKGGGKILSTVTGTGVNAVGGGAAEVAAQVAGDPNRPIDWKAAQEEAMLGVMPGTAEVAIQAGNAALHRNGPPPAPGPIQEAPPAAPVQPGETADPRLLVDDPDVVTLADDKRTEEQRARDAQLALEEAGPRLAPLLTQGELSGDFSLLQAEDKLRHQTGGDNVIGRFLGGTQYADQIRERDEKKREAIAAEVQDLGARFSGGKEFGSVEEVGERIHTDLQQRAKDLKAEGHKLYQESEAGNARINRQAMSTLEERALKRLADENIAGLSRKLHPAASGMLKTLNKASRFGRGESPKPKKGAEAVPDAFEGVNEVTVKFLDQLRQELGLLEQSAANNGDRRVAVAIRKSFDNWFDDAVDNDLASGDKVAMDKLKEGRAVWRKYKILTKTQRDDPDGDINLHIRNWATKNRTGGQVANILIGRSHLQQNGVSARLAKRLKQEFGADSDQIKAVRAGAWLNVTQNAKEKTTKGNQKLASDILAFSNTQMARELFSKSEIKSMKALGHTVRRTVVPKNIRNDSGSGHLLNRMMRNANVKYGGSGMFMFGGMDGGLIGLAAGHLWGERQDRKITEEAFSLPKGVQMPDWNNRPPEGPSGAPPAGDSTPPPSSPTSTPPSGPTPTPEPEAPAPAPTGAPRGFKLPQGFTPRIVGGTDLEQQQPSGDGTRRAPAKVKSAEDIERVVDRVNVNASDAQKQAENYEVAHVRWNGMGISIENPKGSVRRGVSPDGTPWENTLTAHYGRFKGAKGADGSGLDVFIGESPDSDRVYIIDQINPQTGRFDETKVVVGVNSVEEAASVYDDAFSDETAAERAGSISERSVEEFKAWLRSGRNPRKPFDASKTIQVRREHERQAKERATRSDGNAGIQNLAERDGSLSQSEQSLLPQLRGKGDTPSSRVGSKLSSVSRRSGVSPLPGAYPGSDKQQPGLSAREYEVGDAEGAGAEYAQESPSHPSRQNSKPDGVGRGARPGPLNPSISSVSRRDDSRGGAYDASTGRSSSPAIKGRVSAASSSNGGSPIEAAPRAVSKDEIRPAKGALRSRTDFDRGGDVSLSAARDYEDEFDRLSAPTPQPKEPRKAKVVAVVPKGSKKPKKPKLTPAENRAGKAVESSASSDRATDRQSAPAGISTALQTVGNGPGARDAAEARLSADSRRVVSARGRAVGDVGGRAPYSAQQPKGSPAQEAPEGNGVADGSSSKRAYDGNRSGREGPRAGLRTQDGSQGSKRAGSDTAAREGHAGNSDRVGSAVTPEVSLNVARGPQRQTPRPFYSAALRAAENAKQPKANGAQWLGILRNTPGVKQEELDWLGVDQWLQGQGSVTKEALVDFISAHQVEIKEVTKDDSMMPLRERTGSNIVDGEKILARKTKFGEYQLPGGKNYRELLLTLPESQTLPADVQSARKHLKLLRKPQAEIDKLSDAEAVSLARENSWRATGNREYRSSHWDEPNPLLHVRFNEREVDGKKVLLVEEVQSDWHQAGRKKGYTSRTPDKVDKELDEVLAELGRREPDPDDLIEAWDRHPDLRQRHNELSVERNRAGVPDAPFKTTWPEIGMKRMIRWAAENGFDEVAWTPGDEQADRYDLSKNISRIQYMEKKGGSILTAYDLDGEVAIEKDKVTPEQLPDIIGKEAAERLMAAEPNLVGTRELSGVDLKVGGEGMRGFYDKMLPSIANKLGKKFGAKVGTTQVETSTRSGWVVVDPEAEENVASEYFFEDKKEAEETLEELNSSGDFDGWELVRKNGVKDYKTVHSLPITPPMRDAAMAGLPLFKVGQGKRSPIEAGKRRDRLVKDIVRIVRQVAGKNVAIEFYDKLQISDIPGAEAALERGYGRDGDIALAGSYNHLEGLLRIALGEIDPRNTAWHEAWHAIESWLETDEKSLNLLRSELPRLRRNVQRSERMSREYAEALSEAEVFAMAFAAYSMRQMPNIHPVVRSIFDRLMVMLRALRRTLNEAGITTEEELTVADIFESARLGEMKNRGQKGKP